MNEKMDVIKISLQCDERIERLKERIRELEHEVSKLNTCDTCNGPALRHVCRHHCYRE